MKRTVIGAMFDVLPVNSAGQVDFAKITNLNERIDLRSKTPVKPPSGGFGVAEEPTVPTEVAPEAVIASAVLRTPETAVLSLRTLSLRNLEATLAGHLDLSAVVASAGGTFQEPTAYGKPRYIKVLRRVNNEDKQHTVILKEIAKPLPPPELPPEKLPEPDEVKLKIKPESELESGALPEIKTLAVTQETVQDPDIRTVSIEDYYSAGVPMYVQDATAETYRQSGTDTWLKNLKDRMHSRSLAVPGRRLNLPSKKILLNAVLILAGGGLIFVGAGALAVRTHVITQGAAAVESLQAAKIDLENFDFAAASKDFTDAYEEFSKAGQSMRLLSGSIGSFISELPGGGAVKSARNLLSVGKLIAEAGQAMSEVMTAVSKTGWVLNPQSNMRVLSGEILLPLRKALNLSSANLAEAGELLTDVNPEDLPDDKQDQVQELKDKIPQFIGLLEDAEAYAGFFEKLVSPGGTKKYLLLFQNNSELRPTGGFPGTYGVVTFENGRLKDFFADDIYNADGQLKDLIVPPVPLQHITPNWGMRDANWFIDFPTSAEKVAWFFPRETGYDIDGIITINPTLMVNILKVVGPVTVPGFDLTISADNFLTTIQSEVEYADREKTDNQPKKIVKDLAPLVLAKLYSAEKSKWLDVFNVLMNGLQRKDVLMYFKDSGMQEFVRTKGFAGEVKNPDSDFLMTTLSNVKGAKTDAVTDTVMRLDTEMKDDSVRHVLSITRRHNGGSSQYGFYNRQNPSYVRILVPEGAKLIRVSGNSRPGFGPLLNYPKTDFIQDKDVVELESSASGDKSGVMTMREAGKTEFAFWMIVDPREIKTVEVEYEVPRLGDEAGVYELYVQKQPGLEVKDFQFGLKKPESLAVFETNVDLKLIDDVYTAHDTLERDLPIRVKLK